MSDIVQYSALIVDDARAIRLIIKTYLDALKIPVVGEATNGEEAVKLFNELQPTLVFCDIVMPGSDGIELCKVFKEEKPNTNVIMVSSLKSRDIVMAAKKAGADYYIVKPFTKDQFLEMMEKFITVKSEL